MTAEGIYRIERIGSHDYRHPLGYASGSEDAVRAFAHVTYGGSLDIYKVTPTRVTEDIGTAAKALEKIVGKTRVPSMQ